MTLLAHFDDDGNFIGEECHAPRFLRRRQLAAVLGPSRVIVDIRKLCRRQLGFLVRAGRRAWFPPGVLSFGLPLCRLRRGLAKS